MAPWAQQTGPGGFLALINSGVNVRGCFPCHREASLCSSWPGGERGARANGHNPVGGANWVLGWDKLGTGMGQTGYWDGACTHRTARRRK